MPGGLLSADDLALVAKGGGGVGAKAAGIKEWNENAVDVAESQSGGWGWGLGLVGQFNFNTRPCAVFDMPRQCSGVWGWLVDSQIVMLPIFS